MFRPVDPRTPASESPLAHSTNLAFPCTVFVFSELISVYTKCGYTAGIHHVDTKRDLVMIRTRSFCSKVRARLAEFRAMV